MLHRHRAAGGQETVLSQETDDVRKADAGASNERPGETLEPAEQALPPDRLFDDVRVPGCDADEVADFRQQDSLRGDACSVGFRRQEIRRQRGQGPGIRPLPQQDHILSGGDDQALRTGRAPTHPAGS